MWSSPETTWWTSTSLRWDRPFCSGLSFILLQVVCLIGFSSRNSRNNSLLFGKTCWNTLNRNILTSNGQFSMFWARLLWLLSSKPLTPTTPKYSMTGTSPTYSPHMSASISSMTNSWPIGLIVFSISHFFIAGFTRFIIAPKLSLLTLALLFTLLMLLPKLFLCLQAVILYLSLSILS